MTDRCAICNSDLYPDEINACQICVDKLVEEKIRQEAEDELRYEQEEQND